MTEIIKKYIGITHPIDGDVIKNTVFKKSWKLSNCINGVHLFDEVLSEKNHYLHCDICGIEVHISKIVIPDGKD